MCRTYSVGPMTNPLTQAFHLELLADEMEMGLREGGAEEIAALRTACDELRASARED